MSAPLPVVVVGAGPTGVLAALLLARAGVPVVVLERYEGVYALPRAVHLDDEVLRLLQTAGVAEQFAAVSRPARGLRLVDRELRVFAEFRRRPLGRLGHPEANLFDQPDLERLLRDQLARTPGAVLRERVEVGAVHPGDPVTVDLRDLRTGAREHLAAAALLGCDGAGSLVREAVGAHWQDLGFQERWLVVDVRCRRPLPTWDGVHQVCDGRRAATFLQVGPERYRWEFQLGPDETAEQLARPEQLLALVRPWLGPVPAAELEVLRSSGYTFSARLADRWQHGRVFLLGDAAHLTPPFIGQGLGSGLRDAANLAWKLAAVLHGRAPERLLATYEAERRPHARALIRVAVLAGWAMTGGQDRAARLRRVVLGSVFRVPGASRLVLGRGTPPLVRGPLVRRSAVRGVAGRLAPQPRVGAGQVLLDDLLGPGFAVLTTARVDPALRRLAGRLDAPLLELGGLAGAEPLVRWLARSGLSTVVLRPDRAVLAGARSATGPGDELERESADVLRLAGALAGQEAGQEAG